MSIQELGLMEKIRRALLVAFHSGSADNEPHKAWVIDQIVRALTGDDYDKWVETYELDETGRRRAYSWDTGIAP